MATKFFEHFACIATALNETGLWDEEDGFYYDVSCTRRRRGACRCGCARWSGLLPLAAVDDARPGDAGAAARLHGARRLVHAPTGPRRRAVVQHTSPPGTRAGGCSRSCDQERLRRMLGRDARRGRVPLRPRPARALEVPPRRTRSQLELDGVDVDARLRAGRVDAAACSAATRTGAARSGSRSTTCSSRRCASTHRYLGDDVHGRVPDRLGQRAHARARSPTSSPRG